MSRVTKKRNGVGKILVTKDDFWGGGLTVISAISNRQFATDFEFLQPPGGRLADFKEKSQINHPLW